MDSDLKPESKYPGPVMYFVVNKDLNMMKGKIAAQVAHAAIEAFRTNPDTELFRKWRDGSYAKVVLWAKEEELLRLAEKYADCSVLIVDEGRTQIEPGSKTVLGFHIMAKGANEDLCKLRLI